MQQNSGLIVLGIVLAMAFQSCIFQTDPGRPNSPPYIKDSYPEDLLLYIEAPTDSIRFSFTAGDPDLDELSYSYILLDKNGEVQEILHNGPDYLFEPVEGGFYHLQGRAQDHSDYAARDWYIEATEIQNDPPVIESYMPDQDSITTLIGSYVEFRMGVTDDHPENLRYSYYAGGVPFALMSENHVAQYRFMENGYFDVSGIVQDGEYGDTLSWVVKVVGEPDTIQPARIVDLIGWTGPEPGTIQLQWTAPGDDDVTGRVDHYRVRTHTIPILNENDWDEASQKNNVPEPGMPGTTEEMIAVNLNPGTWLFVTVRAVDDFGNMSQLGNCIRLIVRGIDAEGYITDAATGDALAGIVVSSEGISDTTSADGYYKLINLPLYTDLFRVRDEHMVGDPGEYYDIMRPFSGIRDHFVMDFAMMPYSEMMSELTGAYDGSFYKFFRELTRTKGLLGRGTVFKNWNHFPVTVYNPPFSWKGADIQALARTAMTAWNDLTGNELFIETDEPGSADVEIIYDTELYMNHYVETISHNDDGTPAKKAIWLYAINTSAPLEYRGIRIISHELGHVLQLDHSGDLGHLMVGNTAPLIDYPSQDEINLVRALYGMPTIFDATWYLVE